MNKIRSSWYFFHKGRKMLSNLTIADYAVKNGDELRYKEDESER